MAAGLIVLGAALQSLVYFQREFARQHQQVTQQQDVRLGLELFTQELRLAGSGSFSILRPDLVEFMANVSGLATVLTAPVTPGQSTATVEDGRGWPDNKVVRICWNEFCEHQTLARPGQRNLLVFVEPALRLIPSGASAMIMNRVRYYSRTDERGILRWLRQIDGGASVIAGNITNFTLSYWDAQGHPVTLPEFVRRVSVEIAIAGRTVKESMQVGL